MTVQIQSDQFTRELLLLLTEAFESVTGVFLDPGTSLFETLSTISAEEASAPTGGGCATIAAKVAHICFFLDLLDRYIRTGQNEPADWGEVWRNVDVVTTDEWEDLRNRLRQAYQRTRETIQSYNGWDVENSLTGAMGLLAHAAYHLGEIRQATCTIKSLTK